MWCRSSTCTPSCEALVAADLIGALGVPVFIYGELAEAGRYSASAERASPQSVPASTSIPRSGDARTRAELRRGGVQALAERMRSGELTPDFGPAAPHPTAGAALVGARPPQVAFNLELMPPATVADARRIAALIGVALRRRAAPGGAADPSAEGVGGGGGRDVTAQVSLNVERPDEVPLRKVIEVVRAHAAVARAELVGLAPAVALEGFPGDVPLPGFDPARHVIEKALTL
jgi:glutamate formiminotransferase